MPKRVITFLVITICWFFYFTQTVFAVDITPPQTTYSMTPSSPNGDNGWYVSVVQFVLNATDLESGVKEINYRIDNGTWQKRTFDDTLNLAPNPSFELPDATTSGLAGWEATTADTDVLYQQSITEAAPGFLASSAMISSSAPSGLWRGINHHVEFATTLPYNNMTASVWIKTQNVVGTAYFKVMAVVPDGLGGETIQQIAQSSTVTGTSGWTKLELPFVVNSANATGVYLDVGLEGQGKVWFDAVTLNSSTTVNTVSFTVGSDSANHVVEFYSVDTADNIELFSCTLPKKNCLTFKSDLTPPGNWHDSGAFRGIFGPSYQLYVYAVVDDPTSGISVFTDKYQYKTDNNPTFGQYPNILSCSGTWQANEWVILITPPFQPGAKSVYILTPKTNFCNNNWQVCKVVRFYSRDMAGNNATKDFCINGPWINFLGAGFVGANASIDMLAEASGDNTDSVIEAAGTNIDFFTSSRDWKAPNLTARTFKTYEDYDSSVTNKTSISDLPATSGVYKIDGDFEFSASTVSSQYNTASFTQIVFVDGDLTIAQDVNIQNATAALFIVSGNVYIDQLVTTIKAAIITNGTLETAYNITEDEPVEPLIAQGIFRANSFIFQRTLQGTNNNNTPAEEYTFDPKYIIQLKQYVSTNSKIRWKSVE